MSSLENFTVHKNNRDQREERQTREEFMSLARELRRDMPQMRGFAIIVWDENLDARTHWDTSCSDLPGSLVPEFFKKTVERAISIRDSEALVNERT